MAENNTLKILTTHSYPGYQFIGRFEYKDHSSEQCFKYIVLMVQDWICSRTGDEILKMRLGMPDQFDIDKLDEITFQSVSIDESYKLEIISLAEDGIWSARIIEPDTDRKDRKAIVGRSFVTNVGVRYVDDGSHNQEVFLAICTNVLDPENAPQEVAFAYRPAFVKALFTNKDIRAWQDTLPIKRGSIELDSKEAVDDMLRSHNKTRTYLPSLIFTSAFDMDQIRDSLSEIDHLLGLTDAKSSISNQANTIDNLPMVLGKSLLGYCRVYRIGRNVFEHFKRIFNLSESFTPGDVVIAEPANFGGKITEYKYIVEQERILQSDYFEDIKQKMFSYSKNKAYSFEPVLFAPEAMNIQREKMIARIRKETEDLTIEQLNDLIVDNECEIDKLRTAKEKLELENRILRTKLMRQEEDRTGKTIKISVPEVEEYFPGEIRDLILTVLQNRDATTEKEPDTRATELLRAIVLMENNQIGNDGERLFEEIKKVFHGHKNFSDSDFSELKKLGFEKEETKQGDGHIRLHFKSSVRSFSVASTGSDVRGMKNSYAQFVKSESVYKI